MPDFYAMRVRPNEVWSDLCPRSPTIFHDAASSLKVEGLTGVCQWPTRGPSRQRCRYKKKKKRL